MPSVEELTELCKRCIRDKNDEEASRALLQLKIEDISTIDLDWEYYVKQDLFKLAAACIRVQHKDNSGAGLDSEGNTAIHVIIAKLGAGASHAIEGLLAAGIPASQSNKAFDTPLHIAARLGYLDIVKALVAGGADPLKRNGKNRMPRAELKATKEVKEFLLQAEEAAEKAREEKRAAVWDDKMRSVQTDNACVLRAV